MREDTRDITNPPGGVLIWFVILLELLTFIAGIFFYFKYRSENHLLFVEMQKKLNLTFGITNTFFLVTSGYFVALALEKIKVAQREKGRVLLLTGIAFGVGFIFLKSYEYYEKIEQGLTIHLNAFFNFYWFLTFFHFMHVVFATLILLFLFFRLKSHTEGEVHALEVGTSLWHMCDLIWILLFPTLFFIR